MPIDIIARCCAADAFDATRYAYDAVLCIHYAYVDRHCYVNDNNRNGSVAAADSRHAYNSSQVTVNVTGHREEQNVQWSYNTGNRCRDDGV